MAPHGEAAASRCGFPYRNLLLALVLISWILPIASGDGAPQTGAVPLSQAIADLADRLARGIPEGRLTTVAVTDFPDSIRNQTCGLGRFVAERLTTLLSQHRQCRLIERRRLDMVLNELKFSMSELVDPAKARRLGQMLGVQGLVVGSVTDLGGTVDVDARIIDIQTNVSLPGASASIVEDDVVRQMTSDCWDARTAQQLAGQAATNTSGPAAGKTAPAKNAPTTMTAQVGEFVISINGCRKTGGSARWSWPRPFPLVSYQQIPRTTGDIMKCSGSLRNEAAQRKSFDIYVGGGRSYLVDDVGNRAELTQCNIAGNCREMPPGTGI